MSDDSVENTPLTLYKKAYTLHYKERKIAEACDLYEQLIKKFGGTNVAAYASIQLQKIHADDVGRALARRPVPLLPVYVLLAISILLAAGIAVFFSVKVHRISAEREKYSALIRAIGKMYGENDNDALDILREIKISYRNDITPFALSAEIYRKNKQFLRARKEYETYRRLYPNDPVPETEIALINEEEDAHIRIAAEATVEAAMPEEILREDENKAESKAAARAATRKRVQRSIPPRKMPKLLVPADSINFF